MTQIVIMVKLDERGRIIESRLTEYHTREWEVLVSTGWITHSSRNIRDTTSLKKEGKRS